MSLIYRYKKQIEQEMIDGCDKQVRDEVSES